MILFLIILGLLTILWLTIPITKWLQSYKRKLNYLKNMGQEQRHWFWGHLHLIPPNQPGLLPQYQQLTEKYPYLFQFFFGSWRPNVVICHPATAKLILSGSHPKPTSDLGGYSLLTTWIGNGLLLSNGAKWKRSRRLLTPAFHFDLLKNYFPIHNDAAQSMIIHLDSLAAAGQWFDAFDVASKCTLDVMLRCALSQETGVQDKSVSHPYLLAINRICTLLLERLKNPLIWSNWTYWLTVDGREYFRHLHYVHEFSEKIIRDRRKQLEKEDNKKESVRRQDFLDVLLSAEDPTTGRRLTDREIRDEVDTFLFEGHDTTASAMAWFLFSMSNNPDWQERCFQEVEEIFSATGKVYVDVGDLPKLKVLSACLKESMRLYSPVPGISRQVEEDLLLPKECFVEPVEDEADRILPKGTLCDLFLYSIHHNPTVWGQNHNEFDANRFLLPAESDKIDPFAFLPFSAGPRNCIGQNFALNELKVVLARLLFSFQFLPHSSPVEPVPAALIVLRSTVGVRVRVQRRI